MPVHFGEVPIYPAVWCVCCGVCVVVCVRVSILLGQCQNLVICDIIDSELLSHNVFLEILGGVWPIQEVLKKS